MCFSASRAPNQFDARRDVAPSVAAARLQCDTVATVQLEEKSVGLQQHAGRNSVNEMPASRRDFTESLASM